MDVLANSLSVLTREWNNVLGILFIFFLGSGSVFLFLKTVLGGDFTFGEYFVLSAAGELMPLFGGILLAWLLDLSFGIQINLKTFLEVIFIMLGGFTIYRSWRNHYQTKGSTDLPTTIDKTGAMPSGSNSSSRYFSPVLILILVISVYLRLGFISKLVVPLYFDSATHYSIIQGLITDFETSTLPTYTSLAGGYYHLGFHVLAAALSRALNLNAIDTMLILGQIILALIPLPLYFIIKQGTKSNMAAIFSVLLAGWGWYMPAHAVNWGKYPALLSILTFEFVLCSAYLAFRSPKPHRWILIGVLGISILLSTLIHTRSFVLIVITLLSITTAMGWHRLPRTLRHVVFYLILGGLFTLLIVVQSKPVLSLSLDPYRGSGIWMTLLVIFPLPFAMKEFPRATFSSIVSMLFLLESLFISAAKFVPNYAAQALLDRAFVEMFLFLPLTIIGGLGYAGLLRTVSKIGSLQGMRPKWVQWAILLIFFGAFFLNFTRYNFSPSCCQLFGENDQTTLNWMDKNIPSNAAIVISSSDAVLFESSLSMWYAGSDGGIWITPLIHRNTLFLPYQIDFGTQDVLVKLCQRGVGYVYVGGTGQSFNKERLSSKPDWYERVFFLPKAQIYRIVGCGLPG